MCYSNPVSAGSGNKIIPVSTGAGGAQLHPWIPAPPGWDSWKRLGKACQSQSPDGIFVLPGNRAEGKGQSVAGDTGGQWCVLLTWPSASGFGIRNHPPWLPSFSSSFPGTGTAALPPRALSSAGQTPECPGSFLQLFIFEEAGKKSDFLPSFSVGPLPSFPGAASLRLHRLNLGTEGKTHLLPSAPWGLGWLGILLFPEGRIFLTAQSQRGNGAEPERSCIRLLSGRGLGAARPPGPRVTLAGFPALLRVSQSLISSFLCFSCARHCPEPAAAAFCQGLLTGVCIRTYL